MVSCAGLMILFEDCCLELCVLIFVDSKIEKAAASGGEAASERGEE